MNISILCSPPDQIGTFFVSGSLKWEKRAIDTGVGNKKITLRLSLLGTEGQSSQLEIMDLDNLGNIVLSLKKEISIRF